MRRKSLTEQIPLALFSALLMGGAVAFFFFAMPMVLIEQGVIASGLPTIIAAAGPPLGATARALVAGTFAFFAGGTTWGLITLAGMIGRPRVRRSRDRDEAAPLSIPPVEIAAPLPPRRPIFAATELAPPVAQAPEAVVEPVAANKFEYEDVLDLVDTVIDEPVAPFAEWEDELPIIVLMERLEAGAERRAVRAAGVARPVEAPLETTNEFDGALRNALKELQRMAVR